MSVDPTNAAAVKPALTNERDHVSVWDHGHLVDQGVGGEKLTAAAQVADEELAQDEVVPADLASLQQRIEPARVWRTIGQEANPDRRVDEHHQAAECVVAPAPRRRRTSVARGSFPRSARSRS